MPVFVFSNIYESEVLTTVFMFMCLGEEGLLTCQFIEFYVHVAVTFQCIINVTCTCRRWRQWFILSTV